MCLFIIFLNPSMINPRWPLNMVTLYIHNSIQDKLIYVSKSVFTRTDLIM